MNSAQFVAWFEYVRLFSYKLTAEVMRLRNGKVIGSSHLGDDFYRYMLWKWSSKYLFDLTILSLTCSCSCSGHFENKQDQSFYKKGKQLMIWEAEFHSSWNFLLRKESWMRQFEIKSKINVFTLTNCLILNLTWKVD